MNKSQIILPGFDDVAAAVERISSLVVHTPLLRNPVADALSGATVFFKPECLQTTGSFKLRGASNAIANLSNRQRENGVVACSSGNHAQGVAEAARRQGISATIVMPRDAPKIKVERTKRSGAKVVSYDRVHEDRDQIAEEICARTGATFIHPYNNRDVLAGQGTCGDEIARDLLDLGVTPDRVLVCCGGGGLMAGISLAVHHYFPKAQIHPVEPAEFDDYTRSLKAGKRVSNEKLSGSICDAIITDKPGEISFEIAKTQASEGLVVSDQTVRDAVRFLYSELKLVAEPGGAAATAALLDQGKNYAGQVVVVIISGGNADPDLFGEIING